MTDFYNTILECLRAGTPVVTVTIVEASGSIPSEAGARMLVSAEGRLCGTVGGGRVEARALDVALEMVAGAGGHTTRLFRWSLSKDIGMTCGGSVSVYFEAMNVQPWSITIFGAGHVAQSLVRLLVRLDSRVTCIDPRAEWLERLPNAPNLVRIHTDDMAAEVERLSEGAFVLLMTMGHASDSPVLAEVLRREAFPYVGVIGSRAKAVQLRRDLEAAGIPDERRSAFHCPVGLDIGGNHPDEIAISVAAQLLQERDRHKAIRSES